MAICYYCGGSARCAGCGGTGIQADGRTCALCGGNGRCQRCTGGVMRVSDPAVGGGVMPHGVMRSGIRLALAGAALAAGLAMASGARAADSGLLLSTSASEILVFNPATVTTTNVTTYLTQILGRLNGGTPLYDQTFAVPFSDPAAQAGVLAARAAITTAGGPAAVIIGVPVRTAASTDTVSTSVTTYALGGTQTTTGPGVVTFGTVSGVTLVVGSLSTCNVAGLPSTTRPTCQTLAGTPIVLGPSNTNINVHTDTTYTIDQTTQTTSTTTIFEQWTLFGIVQAFGMVHTAVQSGALDAEGRFLRRMGDEAAAPFAPAPGPAGTPPPGVRVWGEAYGVWSRSRAFAGIPGDDRTLYGFAAGLALQPAPGFTLGFAIDHGNTDVKLDSGLERAGLRLTQFGLYAGTTAGPWFASLAGTFGIGDANTQNTLFGQTTASYNLTSWGLLGETGYRMQWGDWRVTPSLGFDYATLRSAGFTETGPLALTAPAHTTDRTRLWAGLNVGQRLGGFDWSVYGRLVGVVAGEERLLPVTYFNLPMTVTGLREARLGGDLGTRLTYNFAPGADFFARYDARLSDGFTSHAGTAGLKVKF